MEKISKNIIIASFIVQTNRDIINIEELLEYSKKLNSREYYVEPLTSEKIFSFFKSYSFMGKIKNDVIELNNKYDVRLKLSKFFLANLDEEIRQLLTTEEKYILPIVVKNELIKYYFSSDNDELKKLKNDFLIDEEKYILDLGIIKKHLNEENFEYFINLLINSVSFEKKEILNCTTINEFIEYIDSLSDIKFNKLMQYLNITSDFNTMSLATNKLFDYYNTGMNNQMILSNRNMKIK